MLLESPSSLELLSSLKLSSSSELLPALLGSCVADKVSTEGRVAVERPPSNMDSGDDDGEGSETTGGSGESVVSLKRCS